MWEKTNKYKFTSMSIKAVYNEKMKHNKYKFTSMSIKAVYNEKMKHN
jgi:hypothetical protein